MWAIYVMLGVFVVQAGLTVAAVGISLIGACTRLWQWWQAGSVLERRCQSFPWLFMGPQGLAPTSVGLPAPQNHFFWAPPLLPMAGFTACLRYSTCCSTQLSHRHPP